VLGSDFASRTASREASSRLETLPTTVALTHSLRKRFFKLVEPHARTAAHFAATFHGIVRCRRKRPPCHFIGAVVRVLPLRDAARRTNAPGRTSDRSA
jgi:hypothetical protein